MFNLTAKPPGVLRLHLWVRLKNGDYQSGNCRVCYQPKQDQWLVFVLQGKKWVNKRPGTRGRRRSGQLTWRELLQPNNSDGAKQMTSVLQNSILESLVARLPVEVIDGTPVLEAAKHVMLEVAYTPVLPYFILEDPSTHHPDHVPTPCRVQKEGDRYCVWMPHSPEKYMWVKPEGVKEMRARYLLLRGWYYEQLNNMGHSERQVVLAKFFPEGVYVLPTPCELETATCRA